MKKSGLILLFLIVVVVLSCKKEENIKVISASSNKATIKINSKKYTDNWTIMPDVKPDILPIEIEKEKKLTTVTFFTDLDSIIYQIGLGESKEFVVLLNKKDSAFTRITGIPPKVNFTDAYIEKNKGKWSVEVIEAQELLQVIFAITPTGLKDIHSMIINHDSTTYYKSVLEHFIPFKDEPIVTLMDSLIRKNWYINLKADACALVFDDDNQLRKSVVYDRMRGSKNLLDPYITKINAFAEKSNFRDFYSAHKSLYDSLIHWHERSIPTQIQWDWLERQFLDHKYDSYRITFSPLVKGNHSTVRFNNNGFKQAVMFIAPPKRIKNVNEKVSEGLITRIVFTEIDHNYVNPETDKHLDKINKYFKDRIKWTAGKESKGYNSPYRIFNEYMTWSVYLLYCYDQYEPEDFEIINKRIINYVVNRRGFHRFDEFHNTLLKLYVHKKPSTTIADLYTPLLEWASHK